MNKALLICILLILASLGYSQEKAPVATDSLSLDDVIILAKTQSVDALLAKHQFMGSYWAYRSYRANLLPQLALNATLPNLNRSLTKMTNPENGSQSFVIANTMTTSGSLELSQSLFLTGGQISISSGLQRLDNFSGSGKTTYGSTPMSFGLSQPLNRYNKFKWDKKTEPLKYEKEKKNYLIANENITIKAINYFFAVATSQLNYKISEINYQNADTLYKLGQGRYRMGVIAENELLQLELSLINSRMEIKRSELDLIQKRFLLINFLNLGKDKDFQLKIPDKVPSMLVDYEQILQLAYLNNPEILSQEIQLIEQQNNLAKVKSEKGVQANIYMAYTLNQFSDDLSQVYSQPDVGQLVQVGVRIPILDWGRGRGQYKMAKSNMEVVKTTIEQSRQLFEQSVYSNVMEFNFQHEHFLAACKADTVAEMRFFISKQRYLIGKISTLELNDALAKRDEAQRAYLSSIQNFWTNYYELRKLTLHDFIEDKDLGADFDALTNN